MIPSLRTGVAAIVNAHPAETTANAGLELDRYVRALGDNNTSVKQMLRRVCASPLPGPYADAFARWERAMRMLAGPDCWVIQQPMRVRTRMIIGLGVESARETNITLHPLYGVPLVPGTAAKGLARRFAEQALAPHHPELARGRPDNARLFGEVGDTGYVTFHDAWHIPERPDAPLPLRRDVITVHHPTYYSSRGKPSRGQQGGRGPVPWDLDDPNPVPYVTATGSYLMTVAGPTRDWAELAMRVLVLALGAWGIGAKTEGSTYGRLEPDTRRQATIVGPTGSPEAWQPGRSGRPALPDDASAGDPHPLAAQLEPLEPAQLKAGQLQRACTQWERLPDGPEKARAARQIVDLASRKLADWPTWLRVTYALRAYLRRQGGGA